MLNKEEIRDWFVGLQQQICLQLESADGEGKFISDEWKRSGGGGGVTRSEAIAELYRGGNIAGRLASLAPALAADAEAGAIYALKSLRINMAKLAHVCRQHIKRYGHEQPTLGCQGGLWTSGVYRRAFAEAVPLWCEMPADNVLFDLPPPVHGSAAIARRLLPL